MTSQTNLYEAFVIFLFKGTVHLLSVLRILLANYSSLLTADYLKRL